MSSYNIYWLRNDIRALDNQALSLACEESESLSVVYVLPENFSSIGSQRRAFLLDSLKDFSDKITKNGLILYISEKCLSESVVDKELKPNFIYYSKSNNFRSKQEENNLASLCDVKPIEQSLLYGAYPFSLSEVPQTFTQYKKQLEKKGRVAREHEVVGEWPDNKVIDLPTYESFVLKLNFSKSNSLFFGGETAGLKRLNDYLWESRKVETYKETRNGMLDFDDSSKLSPWLALGCISAQQVDRELQSYEEKICANESTYWLYFELLWRDYFKILSAYQGEDLFLEAGPKFKELVFSSNQKKLFEDWCNAKTENDFVNANMKELALTGWMSNRGRQNVASYLTKTLGVNWIWGARWFEKHLLDYDIESNWGNWAYLAGVSVDPRDRKFNVERQASIYDPKGIYRSKFLKS